MRRLVVIVVVLGALGVGADVGAKQWAEGQIESRARAEVPADVSVAAQIHAFPFLPALFLNGKVAEAEAHFKNIKAGVLTFSDVVVDLHGIRVNRHELLNNRRVQVESISEGTVTAEITAAALTSALRGVPVVIANGEVKVTIAGASVVARVAVSGNALQLGVPGVGSIAIPKTRLVPCVADVTVLAGRIRLSCTIHDVPPALLGAANAR